MYQRIGPIAFKKDLKNTLALLDEVGNPHQTLRCIHIAGTNGKGSTAHILSSIYQRAGFKVGIYTSPHYKDFVERIKINGEPISKKYVNQFVQHIKHSATKIKPSFFEITVAMAFAYFRDENVDIAIIETGLGGRLDSTNVVKPLISVITNISLDHTQMLGETLPEIAFEKAGIIKRGIPVLIGERQEAVASVFIKKSRQAETDIYFAEEMMSISEFKEDSSIYSVKDPFGLYHFTTDISGDFQKQNLRTAIVTVHLINKHHPTLYVGQETIIAGLKNIERDTMFMGRWQTISDEPKIIVDSAHNIQGIEQLVHRISKQKFQRLHIIIGFVKDKNLGSILAKLPHHAKYYFVAADVPRAKPADQLMKKSQEFGLKGKHYRSVRRGLAAAKKSSKEGDLILVAGSIFVVAEVL